MEKSTLNYTALIALGTAFQQNDSQLCRLLLMGRGMQPTNVKDISGVFSLQSKSSGSSFSDRTERNMIREFLLRSAPFMEGHLVCW